MTEETGIGSYKRFFSAYLRIFASLGLSVISLRADPGAIGGEFSHEFHIPSMSGESCIFYDRRVLEKRITCLEEQDAFYAMADDMHDPSCCSLSEELLLSSRSIEVGHIFSFGTKYSSPMGACVADKSGRALPVYMSSYGIGISRLVGAIIETSADEKGIVWPSSIAPFGVSIVNLDPQDEACVNVCETLYRHAQGSGLDPLLDDTTDKRAGEKFAVHDLIGIPWHVYVGSRNLKGGSVSLKSRATMHSELLSVDACLSHLSSIVC